MFLPIVPLLRVPPRAMKNPEPYLLIITALLPLTTAMTLLQVNPYRALMLRGMVGAIAALLYAVLGAADVALTEALVGTLLAMLLYVITVRSSMVFRLGILTASAQDNTLEMNVFKPLRQALGKHFLRLTVIPYDHPHQLEAALQNQQIHGHCRPVASLNPPSNPQEPARYRTQIGLPHLYQLLQTEKDILSMELMSESVQASPQETPQ